jgi:hypothetical protein
MFLYKIYIKIFSNNLIAVLAKILNKNIKYQNIFVTQNFLEPKYYYFKYLSAYKYKINNIPFPIGYLHNQRDALIDHPTFGSFWVRLLYILQWFVLTILFIFRLKRFSK